MMYIHVPNLIIVNYEGSLSKMYGILGQCPSSRPYHIPHTMDPYLYIPAEKDWRRWAEWSILTKACLGEPTREYQNVALHPSYSDFPVALGPED